MSFLRKVRTLLVVSIVVILGAVVLDNLPSDTEVNADIPTPTTVIPAGARQLDPSKARPGLIATTTTAAPIYGPDNPSDYLVIDQGSVYRVPRTPLTSQLLWLATKGQ